MTYPVCQQSTQGVKRCPQLQIMKQSLYHIIALALTSVDSSFSGLSSKMYPCTILPNIGTNNIDNQTVESLSIFRSLCR